MARLHARSCVAIAVGVLVSSLTLHAAGHPAPRRAPVGPYAITGVSLVQITRVNWLVSDFVYRAVLSNRSASAIEGAVARTSQAGPGAEVRDGSVTFARVPAGAQRMSIDTFTIRRFWFLPFLPQFVHWTIEPAGATANRPPAAAIAPLPGAVFVAQPMTLDGSASSDPDGNSLTWAWAVVTRPAGSSAALQQAATSRAGFTPDRAGSYEVRLTVSDGALLDSRTATFTTTNTPPVAAAGLPQTAAVGTTITLDGSRSFDVDGSALTYSWTVLSRPPSSGASPSDAAAVMPTVFIDAPGNYLFQLVVRDTNGAASQPSTVPVGTVNSPPVADAGPDQASSGGATVQLTGAASSDADGDALGYQWAFVERPAGSTAALAGADSVAPSFVTDRSGTFRVRLTVTDPSGAFSWDVVIVTTANSRPVANAGPDQTAYIGNTVQLDGTGSSDVDGDPLGYAWSFTSVPAGSTAGLSAAGVATPTFVVDLPGAYVVQLLVSDGAGGTSVDAVVVTTANSRPTANAGPDQAAAPGRTITLDGRGSSDPDLDPITYAWALTTVPADSAAALSDPTAAQPTFATDLVGTYVAQLIVHDGVLGSAADTVTVSSANTPPVANAGEDWARVAVDTPVDLDGYGSSDADGHSLGYRWAILSQPPGSAATLFDADTPAPYFVPGVGGTYVLQLIVNDGFADSLPDTVVVPVNQVPVADAGPDQMGAVGVPVTLHGAGTDADGDVLGYWWELTPPPGSGAALSAPYLADPSFTPDVSGTYVARLYVLDGWNQSSADEVVVTVSGGPTPPD